MQMYCEDAAGPVQRACLVGSDAIQSTASSEFAACGNEELGHAFGIIVCIRQGCDAGLENAHSNAASGQATGQGKQSQAAPKKGIPKGTGG